MTSSILIRMKIKGVEKGERRGFLNYLMGFLLTLIILPCARIIYIFISPHLLMKRGRWAKIGRVHDFPEKSLKYNQKFGCFIFNSGDTLHIYSSRCPHLGCTVTISKEGLECPCHGSRFTFEGKVIKGPSMKDLEPLKTRINERGEVLIQIR